MSILGKMIVGFRNILVVNSEIKMPICFRSVNVFVMCASCRNTNFEVFFFIFLANGHHFKKMLVFNGEIKFS